MENIHVETAQNASPQTCTVTLQLVGGWLPKTISDLEKLLKEIFCNKTAVLTHLKIVQKCVLVTYLVQSSEAISLIEAARPKISFMLTVQFHCVLIHVSLFRSADCLLPTEIKKCSEIFLPTRDYPRH